MTTTTNAEGMSEDRINAIRERCDKATRGKWFLAQSCHKEHETEYWVRTAGNSRIAYCGCAQHRNDAEFIADSRTDIPDLLSEVALLKSRLTEAEAIVSKLPKTADGVPLFPGREVWEISADGERVYCCTMPRDTGREFGDGWNNCYSTREAALAAHADSGLNRLKATEQHLALMTERGAQ